MFLFIACPPASKDLTTVIHGTNEFDATTNLSNWVRRFQEETGIQNNNAEVFGQTESFLHTLNFTRPLDFPTTRIIHGRRWRRTGSPEAEKEEKKLPKKVPTFDEVQRVNAMVVEFLQRDLGQKVLQYRELSALNFLIPSFRLNGRSGPILNLTWDDVQTIQQTGALKTDQHRTGSYYDVTLKKKENQHVLLKRMRGQFIKEFQTSPTLVFPTSNNTVDHSMSRAIRPYWAIYSMT